MKNIIIVGVSRAGKTTLAQAVARAIGATGMAVSFISADALFGGVTEIKKHSLFYVAFARPLKHLIPALGRRHKRNLRRDLHTVRTDLLMNRPRFLSSYTKMRT